MAPTPRLFLIASIIVAIPIYYVFIASEGLLVQIAGVVVILFLVSLLLFTGRQNVMVDTPSVRKAPQIDMVGVIELPPPVLAEEGVGQRREGKLRRSRGRQATEPVSPSSLPPPIPIPIQAAAIELEDSGLQMGDSEAGLAKVYIATSDPESQMETEVENYLAHRRVKKDEIRDRIYRERRIKLARRVASEVSKWTEVEDGEDISGLLENPNHGLTVLTEPEEPDPSIPQGISYVRIDANRIVKVRVSLDVPRRPGGTPEPELPEPTLSMLPPDPLMPPSPSASDMPPPPSPLPGPPNLPPPARPGE
jgi:hypothetical protein